MKSEIRVQRAYAALVKMGVPMRKLRGDYILSISMSHNTAERTWVKHGEHDLHTLCPNGLDLKVSSVFKKYKLDFTWINEESICAYDTQWV